MWQGREHVAADRAEVAGAIAHLDLKSLQQTYVFVIYKYAGDVIRRKDACRDTMEITWLHLFSCSIVFAFRST